MKIRVILTCEREYEVKPDWYPDGAVPSFEVVSAETVSSVADDPFLFIDDESVKVLVHVIEVR